MRFDNLRRVLIAQLTEDKPMSTTEAFDAYDRLIIDVNACIGPAHRSSPLWDPEYKDFIDIQRERKAYES